MQFDIGSINIDISGEEAVFYAHLKRNRLDLSVHHRVTLEKS
jgi:hypothetical protein